MLGKKRIKAEVQAAIIKWERAIKVIEAEELRLKNEAARKGLSKDEKVKIKTKILKSQVAFRACRDRINQLKREESKAPQ